eukprot:2915057-Pyramimonas_sp.AAC.1
MAADCLDPRRAHRRQIQCHRLPSQCAAWPSDWANWARRGAPQRSQHLWTSTDCRRNASTTAWRV